MADKTEKKKKKKILNSFICVYAVKNLARVILS